MKERDGADLDIRTGSGARLSERNVKSGEIDRGAEGPLGEPRLAYLPQ